jgi:hypothetical protein
MHLAGSLHGELMAKNHMLIIFIAAGLVLAVVLGAYFYRSNLGPSQSEFVSLLNEFVEKIAAGDFDGARKLMTEETRGMLREPGTVLGETVYHKLKLKSIDSVYNEGNGGYAADVILTVPDTLKIMTKAGILFGERAAESGPVEDPDHAMAEIYEEILSRDDIPMIDNFCVIRMEMRGGQLLVLGDAALQKALEGGVDESSNILDVLSGQ